ncbi:MAG: DUF2238 domain-containing protein [Opitutaceae bacterium]|nr:DUF2238 domain-containing protein [Opitutaceae bacterium]
MFPKILLVGYLVLFFILGIHPYDRGVWFAENLPIILIVLLLVVSYGRFRFSNLSYFLMSCLIVIHTIGGHYTFERVPFGFVTELFDFSRNHYDRLGHFSVGFYAYPMAEILLRRRLVNSKWILLLFPIFFIFTVAGAYELFEWQFALMADPEAGIAVLGSQGDVWDTQKDILSDALGSFFAMALFFSLNKRSIRERIG